ncbi:plasminogen activator inhibitor 1 RNA-binding protein-like [Toxorhynchites rutilus septentrionalis]|uniref:plasminogen activator inhibitor 1 RNA-binding protein-like n=1 Tax=Toxorhynchites rutilus septentrionalis TaxID=329112 RepID=UPI00247AFB4F|nr:plasminogen activator inhibitor 1 RNA-binding protein-like [Toxorhynchites rutilus septentrionalis]
MITRCRNVEKRSYAYEFRRKDGAVHRKLHATPCVCPKDCGSLCEEVKSSSKLSAREGKLFTLDFNSRHWYCVLKSFYYNYECNSIFTQESFGFSGIVIVSSPLYKMEITSYGINVANRYDLFSLDDEDEDPIEALIQNKHRVPKKQSIHTSSAAPDIATKPISKNPRNAEKENKIIQNKAVNNENKHPDKHLESKLSATGNLPVQRVEKHGIKETQKDNIRAAREDDNKNGFAGGNDRRHTNKTSPNTENRDEKNRKNRVAGNDESIQRKLQNGNNKRFETRGKREFDRQSGSNKTGVKAVEKRDGTGSHNWGSVKIDAKDYNNLQADYLSPENDDDKGNISDQTKEEQEVNDNKIIIEDELKEMTLDEWKAQIAAARSKPQYNLRKAGEGEDATQWDKMVALDKKKANTSAEEENETQKTAKQKQVLEIEFHFNDGRRGGLMGRSKARTGKGPRNTGRRENEKKETFDVREVEVEKRDRRNRPTNSSDGSFGNYKFSKQSSRVKNAAPKVDDEHDFPSLG